MKSPRKRRDPLGENCGASMRKFVHKTFEIIYEHKRIAKLKKVIRNKVVDD